MLTYTSSESERDLQQILALQQSNLESRITDDELKREGFVMVNHTLELLAEIAGPYGHMMAKVHDKVIAYALVMLKDYGNRIPVLKPMFDEINQLHYQNKSLDTLPYVVMGQVCIDKAYRGTGVFQKMYEALQKQLSATFMYLITEVAQRNQRSIHAHQKVGFKTIKTYEAEGEVWEILLWNWRDK